MRWRELLRRSPIFSCLGHNWRVGLSFTNGTEPASNVVLTLFKLVGNNNGYASDDSSDTYSDGFLVRFGASIKDMDGKAIKRRKKRHYFSDKYDTKSLEGIDRDFIIDQTNNILHNGTLTIELRIESLEKSNICQPFIPANPLSQNIKKFFLDETTADVMFAVQKEDGGEVTNFYAHRFVLQACAENLSSFCDSSIDLAPVAITRVDPEVFKLMLCYIYGGTIANSDWKKHAQGLLDAADLYALTNLKLEAEARYVSNTTVTIDNIVHLLTYADSKQCSQLKEVVMDFVVENKKAVLKKVSSLEYVPESSTMFTDLLAAMARGDDFDDSDDEESVDPMDTMRVGELRRKLNKKGLDIDGSREALVSRLKEHSKAATGKRKRSSQG